MPLSKAVEKMRDFFLAPLVFRDSAHSNPEPLGELQLDTGSGTVAAGELVALPAGERPTAIFAANDLLAIGLLQGFVTNGVSVPEEISLIGYDDIDFAAAAAVPLSSVRQPRHALGVRAAELLFAEIDSLDNEAPHEHQHIEFAPDLVVRRSTAEMPYRLL